MLRYFRVKKQPDKVVPDLGSLSGEWLRKSPDPPITIWQINGLPENAKRRVYRALLPLDLLAGIAETLEVLTVDQAIAGFGRDGSGVEG